jgi:UDP-N-acetylmuramate dehydrogenase
MVWHLAALAPRFERHGRVEVFGGLALDALVRAASREGLWGVENLSAIPGTVGAAPVQNVGAYGQSLDEVVEALEVLDLRTGQCAWWTAKDCAFSYRNSRFRQSLGAYLVLTLRLRLHRGGRPVLGYAGVEAGLAQRLAPGAKARPSDLVEAVRALRADKLPDWRRLPNVGSFFKNPQLSPEALQRLRARAPELALRPFASSGGKVSAAALIQGAGWRGRRRGPVGMAQQHALVLVNYGGATRDDVDWLAGSVQASVYASFRVRLEREPLHL